MAKQINTPSHIPGSTDALQDLPTTTNDQVQAVLDSWLDPSFPIVLWGFATVIILGFLVAKIRDKQNKSAEIDYSFWRPWEKFTQDIEAIKNLKGK